MTVCDAPWGHETSQGTLETPPKCESPWAEFDYGLIPVGFMVGFMVDDFIVLG